MTFLTFLKQLLCPHKPDKTRGYYNENPAKGAICTWCGKELNP